MRFRRRDQLSSGFVLALVGFYLAFLGIDRMPLIDDTRAMASIALILGGANVAVLLSGEQHDAITCFNLGIAVIGVVLGTTSLALAGTPAADILLAAFVGTVLLTWGIELAEHVSFPPPRR